ncbi:galactosyltransferase [Aliiruegeria haliotis]|uniref:Galactosyltransferase n=1 Tax=Aliiruegeria haliotis TaxID=1280846 RepID=A0A2T0RPB2_9RHOB|nr:glycosyltransferase family 2 protein [Aliiruegeria haliotis]PRY23008.1 galactosyltransferase [Aliiruegeria haliotis]
MLLSCQIAGETTWECLLRKDRFDHANVSFFDAEGEDILFHLSFRFPVGAMVFNSRFDGTWGGEVVKKCPVVADETPLRISFTSSHIRVEVAGREILRHRRRSGAAPIHWFDLHGGFSDLRIDGADGGPATVMGELAFTEPFALEGWAIDVGAEKQDIRIKCSGGVGDLPLARLTRPGLAEAAACSQIKLGVSAILPGRFWHNVPEGEDLTLQLVCNGKPCAAPLRISRREIVEIVEAALDVGSDKKKIVDIGKAAASSKPDKSKDAFLLVSAVEHAAFADIIDDLSAGARKNLLDTVTAYKLQDLLPSSRLIGDVETEEFAEIDRETAFTAPVNAVQKDLARFLAKQETPDPAAFLASEGDRLIETMEPEQARLLALRLTEVFCTHGAIDALNGFAMAARLGRADPKPPSWQRSLRLPLDVHNGEREPVVGFFQWLAERPKAWISTANLGWSMRQIVENCPPFLTDTDRETAARAFVDYVGTQADDYWGTSPCRHLVDTMVSLLENRHLFSSHFNDWLVYRAIRIYWMSPGFWTALQARPTAEAVLAEPALGRAYAAWERLESAVLEPDQPVQRGAPLPPYSEATSQAVRELALAGRQVQNLAAIDPFLERDLALRRLAMPNGRHLDGATPDFIAQSVREFSKEVPANEYVALQERASRHAVEWIADLGTDPEASEAQLQGIAPLLRVISGRRAGFVGIATAISMVSAALREGADREAEAAARLVRALLTSVAAWDQKDIQVSPAVRMSAFGLRQTALVTGNPQAHVLLDHFTDALANVPEPASSEMERMIPRGGMAAFFDTLVVIFSCRPLLETRVKAQRETWIRDLQDRGIPYVIVVGDGDDRLEGDVLHLNTPDGYEGLPRKVLDAVRWVQANTAFSHMLKIDDDCFLSVDRYFHSQSYRKFAYYGRKLTRDVGQTDRTWHLSRAKGGLHELDIDRSPEPSDYAEGGTGYALNRTIMEILIRTADTPKGAQLTLSSIMEDKQTGDLLGMCGILPDSEDFDACVMRRSHSKAHPVSRWVNTFLPSASSPAKVAHLDSADLQPLAARTHASDGLYPKKVWPSFKAPIMGHNSNIVELVCSEEQFTRVNTEDLVVVCCARNEKVMLPHFLDHYRRMGVNGFLMIDNFSDDGSLEYLLEQPDVATFSAETDYSESQYGVAWQQAVLSAFRQNRWSLVADADELLVLRSDEPSLPDVVKGDDLQGFDAARVFMLDLYPGGDLSDARLGDDGPFDVAGFVDREPFLSNSSSGGPFSNAETYTSSLRHRLLPGSRPELFVAQKIALLKYKPWMRLSAGLHYVANAQVAPRDMIFAHFKYHADFHRKVREETERGEHFNNAEEYRRYKALLSEGRDSLFDPEVSVPWRDCDWVKARL